MNQKLSIYELDPKYAHYLNKQDPNTRDSSSLQKQHRKYIGIIIMDGTKKEYLIPLSSPKPKHATMKNTIDFIKIAQGKLGAININNMIPVDKSIYKEISIKNESNPKYKRLLENQYRWINKPYNQKKIVDTAQKLFTRYKENTLPSNIQERCANLKKAEKLLERYLRTITTELQR